MIYCHNSVLFSMIQCPQFSSRYRNCTYVHHSSLNLALVVIFFVLLASKYLPEKLSVFNSPWTPRKSRQRSRLSQQNERVSCLY